MGAVESDVADDPIEEEYQFDEPTPADTVFWKNGKRYIYRMGFPPIEVGGGSKEEQFPDR